MAETINVIAVIRGSSFRATYETAENKLGASCSLQQHQPQSQQCLVLLCMLPLINDAPPGRSDQIAVTCGAHRQGPVLGSSLAPNVARSYTLIASIAICKIELKSIGSACSDINMGQSDRYWLIDKLAVGPLTYLP